MRGLLRATALPPSNPTAIRPLKEGERRQSRA